MTETGSLWDLGLAELRRQTASDSPTPGGGSTAMVSAALGMGLVLMALRVSARKLDDHDYGQHWAEIDGDGDVAVITWGSSTGPAREALAAARADGMKAKLIAPRL